mgnify:CR=1 FL=1
MLRFPNFIKEWEWKEAEQIFQSITDKNHPEDTVLTIQQGKGTLPRELSGRNILYDNTNIKNYKRVHFGDFIIHLRSFEGGLEMANEQGIVSPAYTILRNKKNIEFGFYKAYFRTNEFINHVLLKSVEGIRDGKQISYDAFKWLSIPYCQVEEQQKIADFLSLVDLRIEKQRQLVESLKKYKRGLLKSIFKGKTANRILQDCINIGKAGGTPDSANSSYYNGTIPFLSISDMTVQGKYLNSTEKQITREGLDNSSAWLVPPKSLIISMYASYGLVAINNIALSTSQAMFNIIPKNEYLYYYLTYLAFTGYYHKMVSTGTQPNLNANKIRNIPIYMPSDTEKQNITKLLTEVDNKVNAELQYLLLLIQTKKAFLQQMFI